MKGRGERNEGSLRGGMCGQTGGGDGNRGVVSGSTKRTNRLGAEGVGRGTLDQVWGKWVPGGERVSDRRAERETACGTPRSRGEPETERWGDIQNGGERKQSLMEGGAGRERATGRGVTGRFSSSSEPQFLTCFRRGWEQSERGTS